MFGHNRDLKPVDGIVASQQSGDAKEGGEELLKTINQNTLFVPEGHLWLMENQALQVAGGLAVVAFVNDMFAENLLAAGEEASRKDGLISPDIERFAAKSSDVALDQLKEAIRYFSNVPNFRFEDETREGMMAESQFPFWPPILKDAAEMTLVVETEYEDEEDYPEWINPDYEPASDAFIKATLGTATDVWAFSTFLLQTVKKNAMLQVREDQVDEITEIIDGQLAEAKASTTEAKAKMQEDKEGNPLPHSANKAVKLRFEEYKLAHDGLVGAYQATINTMMPQMLHDDFGRLERQEA